MLKLVARGARTKTAKVWWAPYVKDPPVKEMVVDWNWSGRSLEPTEGAGGRAEVETG